MQENQDKKKISKSIIMMLLLALLLMGVTYAWLINITHTDITSLDFYADDNIAVTFWDYNTTTAAFDIPLRDGDLKLTGMKPGTSKTVRMKLERYSPDDKGLYIKLLGVEAKSSDGSAPIVISKGGAEYNIGSFIMADVLTVTFGGIVDDSTGGPLGTTIESITVTGNPIPFDKTDNESILDILELVQNYPWPTDGSDYEVKYLDLVISLVETRNVTGGSISIQNFQKQKITAGKLNVQAVDI
jgi:hypothetical protein